MAKINEIDITSLLFQEGSAPSTPASTKWRLYFKTDGVYVIDDAGTEVGPLAASSTPAAVAARVTRTTNQTITDSTVTAISWTSETFDTNSIWTVTPNPTRLTAPSTGKYRVTARILWNSNGTGLRHLRIHVNGTAISTAVAAPSSTVQTSIAFSDDFDLTSGDYVEVNVYQTSGGNLDLVASSGATIGASMVKL